MEAMASYSTITAKNTTIADRFRAEVQHREGLGRGIHGREALGGTEIGEFLIIQEIGRGVWA